MSGSLMIVNARAVLPDRVLDEATVVVREGRITAITSGPGSAADTPTTVDAGGAWLLPGIVDLHNDALETEINPRAAATLPLPFAFATLERRLAAAGVTTEFHALSFNDDARHVRSLESARAQAAWIVPFNDSPQRAVRHNILHRLDLLTPDALDAALPSLTAVRHPFVSLNDHTPGQGQFHDVERLIAQDAARNRWTDGQSREHGVYGEMMRRAREDTTTVPALYRRLAELRATVPLVVATHDDDTPERVAEQRQMAPATAEFPLTLEIARLLRIHGVQIEVGAPNIVRGGSQSGNLAATDLVAAGLADIICADYHAPSLIPAAFILERDHGLDLPAAIAMVTRTPARAVGLTDRGEIAVGQSGDLALVRMSRDGWPQVERTWVVGRSVFTFQREMAE